VAKILVADDNSNIQRMVGLALKDQGIEVVAVGNGEAAVRKISELRPDLVLADVFMPVRNGYEVCQYVKEDESLKHIPVILLVGAFDPLDEQEAQRVGADGVLKKPFVPPDPLIAMVKAALERAGISLSPAGATKTAPVPARKAADLLPPAQSPAAQSPQAPPVQPPTPQRSSPLAGISFSGSAAPPAIVVADESFVDSPAAPEPVNAEAASNTIAFGSLLDSAAPPAPAAEDPGFSTEDMEAVTAKDWRSLEETVDVPEEEEEESKESVPSWRRDESASNFEAEDGVGPVKDWRDSAEMETVGRKSAREVWEQAEATDGFAKATDVPSAMASFTSELSALEAETTEAKNQTFGGTAELEAAPQAPSHAASFPEEAPLEVVSPAPEITAMSLPVGKAEEAHGHDQFVSETHATEVAAEPAAVEEPAFVKEVPAPVEVSAERTEPKSATNSWFSTPSSPWDTDAQHKEKLAASWDSGKAATESGAAATTINNAPETHTNGESSHEEVTAVLADEPAASVSAPEAPAEPAASPASGSEAEMDALIARVMAKLNPEALNAMAQQILKPAVAAILADELKSKK
jgi:CheY-like chemotaxis protein